MDNPKIAVADSARKSASGGTGRDLSPSHASYQGDELCWYGALDVRFRHDGGGAHRLPLLAGGLPARLAPLRHGV
ncbi:MAG: hypothetical protein WAL12_10150, partial [Trebonia sp.]